MSGQVPGSRELAECWSGVGRRPPESEDWTLGQTEGTKLQKSEVRTPGQTEAPESLKRRLQARCKIQNLRSPMSGLQNPKSELQARRKV